MKRRKYRQTAGFMIAILMVAILALSGCSGDDGAAGTAGTSTGTVSGYIGTDATHPVSGVVVSNNLNSTTATSDGNGNYSMALPIGVYTLTFTKSGFTTATASNVSVAAGTTTTTSNVTLSATASGKPSVTVTAAANNIGFDQTTTATATATPPSGGTIASYSWSGTDTASTTNTATVRTLTLAKAMGGTAAPSTDPGGYVSGYVQENRFGVLPIFPDTRGGKTATVTVKDGLNQSVSASVTVNAAGISTGLKNVPVGVPVFLNSGHADPNTWTVTTAPTGSTVATGTLANAATRNASFTPDKAGKYTVAEGANSMDIYAGTWIGAISGGTEDANGLPSVTPNPGLCTICHDGVKTMNGITIPDKFTPWAKTPHATFYATGLNGLTSNNRSGACASCHSVGYDNAPLAVNGGYDDLVAQTGWVYPSTAQKGNWAAMWADAKGQVVAKMTNIQCENCHGPNSDNTAHTSTRTSTTYTQGLRTSLSSEICAACHASGTGHHNYSEWRQTDPDTGYGHVKAHQGNSSFSGSGSCARCHTGQGFLTYLAQLKAGNIGSISSGTLPSVVTAANAVGVTCTTCHDPHDAEIGSQLSTATGVPRSTQLRVFGETDVLPAGFKVTGMGAGALCFTCHNSRNGAQSGSTTLTYLHEDGQTYNSGNPTGFSAPHQAAQGDVLAGRNAYFMGTSLPMMSKHASVEESCVGCHMKLNPLTHLSHGAATPNTHVMYIRDKDKGTLCANCHGATNGEALVASIEDLLASLKGKMESALKAKLDTATALAPFAMAIYVTDGSGNIVLDTKGNEVSQQSSTGATLGATNQLLTYDGTNKYTSVVAEEVHGQIGFLITLTNPVSLTITSGTGTNAVTATYSVQQFEVQLGKIFDKTNPTWPVGTTPATIALDTVYKLSGNMVRAGWNYYLIEGDQSKGIHNPTFATLVLNNTLGKDLSN